MTRIAISGYASLDYVVQLAAPPQPSRTVAVTSRAEAWPRPGGSPIYVGAAIRRAGGVDISLITWVGADVAGSDYIRRVAALALSPEGVVRSLSGHTPICILAYDPSGVSYCLYEASASTEAGYNPVQLAMIEAADWICLTVQPASAARAALARISDRQRLVWAVKGDPDAFPEDLRRDLAARADLVVHSQGERDFVAPFLAAAPGRTDRLVVETQGADGAALTIGGRMLKAPLEKTNQVMTSDPTGAGDTFLGGLIAALIVKRDPVAALRAGEAAAREMLIARQKKNDVGVER
jgi:ribokinase